MGNGFRKTSNHPIVYLFMVILIGSMSAIGHPGAALAQAVEDFSGETPGAKGVSFTNDENTLSFGASGGSIEVIAGSLRMQRPSGSSSITALGGNEITQFTLTNFTATSGTTSISYGNPGIIGSEAPDPGNGVYTPPAGTTVLYISGTAPNGLAHSFDIDDIQYSGGDTTSPDVSLSSVAVGPVHGDFTITVTFSEAVNGFTLGEIDVGNGTASNFTGSDGDTVYTATISPVGTGPVTIDVAAGVASDAANNLSLAATQFSIQADASAALVSLDAASDLYGQVLATEASSTLIGNLVLDFGLSDRFVQMGAGGEVDLLITLSNAVFDQPVNTGDFSQATDPDCAFQIASGGGARGSSIGFVSTGQVNACSGFDANDGSILLPIEVVSNGDPVSVEVTLTPTNDAGSYAGDSETLEVLTFAGFVSFAIDFDAAADPPVGQFDSNGDALQGTGQIARIATVRDGNVDETTIGGGGASADSADDVLASADVIITFPAGATGIGGVAVSGAGACTPGGGASANVFTCPATGAEVDAFDGATDGLVTITADADNQTVITPQTPTVTLELVADAGFTASAVADTDAAPLSRDDGLETTAITHGDFAWVNLRESGGVTSRFRITGIASGLDTLAGEGIQVTVRRTTGPIPTATALIPDVSLVEGANGTWTATFSSTDLAAALGTTGLNVNGDITLALIHDDTVNHAGARALRLLTRNGHVTGTGFDQ